MPDELSGLEDTALSEEERLHRYKLAAYRAIDTRPFSLVTTMPVRPCDSGTLAVFHPAANVVVQHVYGPVEYRYRLVGPVEPNPVAPHHAEIAAEVNAAAPLCPLTPLEVALLDDHAPGLTKMPDLKALLTLDGATSFAKIRK